MTNWIGRQLGPYELTDLIGRGSVGEVYKASSHQPEQEEAPGRLPAPGFSVKLERIDRLLTLGEDTIVAKECVGLIEQALRHLFHQALTHLDEPDRLKVQEAERTIGKGEKGIERFTLGQLVGVFRTSRFLEAWARTSGRDLRSLRVINLDELTHLRNKFIHSGSDASHAEAELLVKCLHVMLETFGLASWRGAEGRVGSGQEAHGAPPGTAPVAIKLIHPYLIQDPATRGRVQRDAQGLTALRHPGIVPVYEVEVAEEMLYLVMAYVAGESLQQRLALLRARHTWLSPEEALTLVRSITEAVAYAHSQGVVHQDLKPANVLLPTAGQPMLTDFGLSSLLSAAPGSQQDLLHRSPHYLSPEQGAGRAHDARADLYALGVLLYELTTGTVPFSGNTTVGVILKHLSEPPAPPRSINPDLPEPVDQIIHTALAKAPEARYPSARELLAALESALGAQRGRLAIPEAERAVLEDGRCPYRGLQTFEAEHAEFFFGREVLITQVVETLATLDEQAPGGRFVAVLGASGSGKSSLVRAGVVPALQQGAIPGSERWTILVLRPGARPLEELAARVAPALSSTEDQLTATRHLLDNLTADGRALHLAVRLAWEEERPDQVLVLVVDQFEEVFTLCQNETERQQFIENLLYVASSAGHVLVLVTMRADFYHRCAAYRDLARRMSAQQVLVGPMNEAEMRRAIERPAWQVGLRFEPGVVELILGDVAQQAGALPLLQHALLELWERRQQGLLTLSAYRESGGVAGAIAQRAELVFATFTPEEQAIVRRVMLRLTQPGEGTEDTRRRVAKAELVPADGQAATVEAIIQQLADARLVTTTRDMVSGEDQVDVAHEALIREWARLRQWLDEDREFLLWQQRLRAMLQQWQQSAQDEGALLRGAPLTEAEQWLTHRPEDVNEPERVFIQAGLALRERIASEREAQRRHELEAEKQRAQERARAARRLLRLAVGLALFLVLAIGAAYLAVQQTRRAEEQTEWAEEQTQRAEEQARRAEQQTRLSTARELAGVAIINLEVDPERSILLALQAVDATYAHDNMVTREAEEALHQAVMASRVQLTLTGHTNLVAEVDISPDGTRLATASFDGTAKVWDLSTGQEVLTLTGHSDNVFDVVFSPDQTLLATAGWDGTAKLWDATSGEVLLTLEGHSDAVNGVAFSPDGTRLATASFDGTAKVWDISTVLTTGISTGQEVLALIGHTNQVWDVNFSPDETLLATGSRDGTAKIWDASTGQEVFALTGHTGEFVSRVAFSPDGRYLATSSSDRTAKIWETRSGREVITLVGHVSNVMYVRFSPDGTRLATGSDEGTAKVWLLESNDGKIVSGREVLTLAGHTGILIGVDFSPDGTRLATGSFDGTARVWDLSPDREVLTLTGHTAEVFRLAFSPDGTRLATASLDGTANVWDISTTLTTGISTALKTGNMSGQKVFTLAGHTGSVFGVAFSPDGTRLVTISADRTAKVWDTTTGQEVLTLVGHVVGPTSRTHPGITGVTFSPDGTRLATASDDRTARVWDAVTGQELLTLVGHADGPIASSLGGVTSVVFHPDGTHLATAGNDGTVRIWEAATGQEVLTLAADIGSIIDVVFSPDGSYLTMASWETGVAKVWDISTVLRPESCPEPCQRTVEGLDTGATTGQEMFTLTGHTSSIYGLAVNSEGTHLATASFDGTAKVWDASTGEALLTLFGSGRGIYDVAFSPDGRHLATASIDGTVRLYVLPIEELVALARSRVTRSLTTEECRQYLHLDECPAGP